MAKSTAAHDTVRRAERCSKCPGWIHNPESLKAHMGPVCRGHAAAEARRAAWNELTLFDLPARHSA